MKETIDLVFIVRADTLSLTYLNSTIVVLKRNTPLNLLFNIEW